MDSGFQSQPEERVFELKHRLTVQNVSIFHEFFKNRIFEAGRIFWGSYGPVEYSGKNFFWLKITFFALIFSLSHKGEFMS